jgi:ankyrin repeat protein
LHLAASQRVEIAEALIRAGADVDATDSQRNTPLMAAAFSGEVEVVGLLLRSRASVDTLDSQGRTALHGPAIRGAADVAKLLLRNGASPYVVARVKMNGKEYSFTPFQYSQHAGTVSVAEVLRQALA